jgi:hypothetical protein
VKAATDLERFYQANLVANQGQGNSDERRPS